MEKNINGVLITKVNKDINGNPRYIFKCDPYTAKNIGAKQYRKKGFDGYYVCQSFNVHDLATLIKKGG